jgi:hypothetical protein
MAKTITEKDRQRADYCLNKCGGCKKARQKQKGFSFWIVRFVEGGVCPNCKAYFKIYGHKAHEPLAKKTAAAS